MTLHGKRPNTRGTVSPAMPLPASIAIVNGLIALMSSMKERQ
jgi:hypothetical protein